MYAYNPYSQQQAMAYSQDMTNFCAFSLLSI